MLQAILTNYYLFQQEDKNRLLYLELAIFMILTTMEIYIINLNKQF
jgi:hypothetical protein